MNQINTLMELLSYITVVSIAVERMVEVLKPLIDSGWAKSMYKTEKGRLSIIYLSSFACGFGLHMVSDNTIPYFTDHVGAAIVAGLLASGGSGVWHDMISILRDYNASVASAKTTADTTTK